jgi:membrane protein required for colicin V production
MPSWLDIIIALVLIFALWRGWKNGFIFELAISCAFFTALYGAFKLALIVQEKINPVIETGDETTYRISFFIAFIVVFITIIFLGKLFSALVNVTPFGIFNRILGALFGFLRYVLLVSLLLWFLSTAEKKFHFIPGSQAEKSVFAGPLQKVAPAVLPVLNSVKKKVTAVNKYEGL